MVAHTTVVVPWEAPGGTLVPGSYCPPLWGGCRGSPSHPSSRGSAQLWGAAPRARQGGRR